MVVVKLVVNVAGVFTCKIATIFASFCDMTNFSKFQQKIKISDFLKKKERKKTFELKISSN